ncbi:MAG TPA: serine protease [Candidatus Acidoferrales bacterium]|nr:serine protease [Candidatus Acidoferrales bacterium]
MFIQSDRIRDYVFPIVTVAAEPAGGGMAVQSFLGTGFLIGNRGYALTASHVLAGHESISKVGMFAPETGGWLSIAIQAEEAHPTEDVAALKLEGGPWKSFFRLSNTWEGSSCKYRMFGYPEDVTYELERNGKAILRPDLIYAEGYVRRRIAHRIPTLKGISFFELSEVAGPGCSGSPIFKFGAGMWDVIGIYVGEKLNERATSVSYAVREDAFRDWVPGVLGIPVLAESQNVSA